MTSHPPSTGADSRETLWAIIGSFIIALILATILTGNPFRFLAAAYKDYSYPLPTTEAPAPATK